MPLTSKVPAIKSTELADANVPEPLSANLPPLRVTYPVKVLEPVNVKLPKPVLTKPLLTPSKIPTSVNPPSEATSIVESFMKEIPGV